MASVTEALPLETPEPRAAPSIAWKDASGSHDVAVGSAMTAGSSPSSDLVVSDRSVSRVHAELVPKEDGLWVRDLGSRNGTYVAGMKIVQARVPDGAVVRLGGAELRVTYGPPQPPKDLWPNASFGPLVGRSVVMRELFAKLARVAPTDSSVLVRGETGTGKELVAQAVHEASRRAAGPFVIVDCAAIPENLVEAELFGHAKGAFTGAVAQREGAFEAADGGTLFLDEVGELPLAIQPKLLRALESRTVRRVGETNHRKVDVRIVSATHRDLRRMVNDGGFREDLYFRLAVLPIVVPPLRERLGDLPLLLSRFLGDAAESLTPAHVSGMAKLAWKGNVRQVRNFAERIVALGPDAAIAMATADDASVDAVSDAPAAAAARPSDDLVFPHSLDPFFESNIRAFRERWNEIGDREYLRRLMIRTNRSSSEAAEQSGLERTYLYRLLKKHDV